MKVRIRSLGIYSARLAHYLVSRNAIAGNSYLICIWAYVPD